MLLPQKIEIPAHPPRRRKVRFTQDTQVWVSFAALPCSSSPKCNRFAGSHLGFRGSHPRRGGLWPPLPKRGAQNVGGIVDPSVSLTADSSPYTGEPLSAATGRPGVIGVTPYTKKERVGGNKITDSPPALYYAGRTAPYSRYGSSTPARSAGGRSPGCTPKNGWRPPSSAGPSSGGGRTWART